MGDFDFLVGTWTVANRRLRERLTGCTEWEQFEARVVNWSLFGGAGNVDEIVFPDRSAGLTLRLYDPDRQRWSLHWASSQTGTLFPPVVGRFTGDTGVFYGDDIEGNRPVRVRFTWSRTPSPRWEQAFSADGERSWETNWIMDFTRA